MEKDVIIALDFDSAGEVFAFLSRFRDQKPFVKIGMELFCADGPGVVRELKARGHRVFLDLKLHDIPNTVRKTMRVLKSLDADIINVHAAGTTAMISAALDGLGDGPRPLLVAVTQLTSTTEECMQNELLIGESMMDTVIAYAKNTKKAGGDGVVCSPLEVGAVKAACGKSFVAVTPGIRLAGDCADDQARTATPSGAAALGSDFIVVGRSITAAQDPAAAYQRCRAEFLGRECF